MIMQIVQQQLGKKAEHEKSTFASNDLNMQLNLSSEEVSFIKDSVKENNITKFINSLAETNWKPYKNI
ncbi:hypothetical protein [Oceanobacillus sp. J11TS1]|uniref:hypothetical protein n=1 Tax=Oceanobacillus sp. J11TS1 TaxID=2807191 RepID=UPI001B0B5738|nr:hypothetical protein [Oceanobacillus sp. J11TS1]GIO23016.1 hypothetical protein J11TS1_15970 [Oceanobacillus sp. J11TS1]